VDYAQMKCYKHIVGIIRGGNYATSSVAAKEYISECWFTCDLA